MSLVKLDQDRYTKSEVYQLACDVCGDIGEIGSFKDCVKWAKDNRWKSKSHRTKDSFNRYIWTHYCGECKHEISL